jgi:hypothetical protein
MYSRQFTKFTKFILGLVFLVTSSFVFSDNQLTYNVSDIENSLEITGCEDSCPNSYLIIPEQINDLAVTRIGENAFHELSFSLLSLPDTITSIGRGAFFGTGLPLIRLPESLKHIEEAAFNLSMAIGGLFETKIIFPENIETIGLYSFAVNNISELHFLGNRPAIDEDAFVGNDLQTVSYCSGAIGWPGNPINGITPVENTSCGNNTEFDYTIEYPSVSIDGCTFFCINDLIIPETIDGYEVKKIGVNGFENSILESITIPKSVEEIGEYAFHGSTASTLNFLGDRPLINGEMSYIGEMLYLETVTYCPNTDGWPGYAINGITPELSEDCDSSSNQSESTQYATFDIDQNGSVGALSDGLILLRYFFNLRGEALIANVIAEDATRTSAADIEAYIESHMP